MAGTLPWCPTDEERRLYESRLPGKDGAERIPRFESVRIPQVPIDPDIRSFLLDVCVRALAQREASPTTTESSVKAMLASVFNALDRPGASERDREIASYIPRTFKEVLTLVTVLEPACRWPQLYRYKMCKCGFIYRGAHQSASVCHGIVKAQGGGVEACGVSREQAREVTYSSIANYVERAYANPEIAADLSSWRQRQAFPRMVERIAARERERVAAHQAANAAAGRPGDPIPPKTPEEKAEDERDSQASTDSMFDMVDGELVKEALRKDPAFAADPRNLLVVLVSDPFIVSA